MADIEIAAATGEPDGCGWLLRLGMIYSAGAGVAVDLVEAHKWFNIAAHARASPRRRGCAARSPSR